MTKPNVVAIDELLWTYHPLDPSWKSTPFKNKLLLHQADIFVQTNIVGSKKRKYQPIYEYIIESGKPWIVAESAVFRKNMKIPPASDAYHRYSWYSYLRDEAEYCNENSPGDRWATIQKEQNIEIKPWRTSGEYVLLCLQKPGDSSLARLITQYGSYDAFISAILKQIQAHTDRKIRIRLHPLRQDRQQEAIALADIDFQRVEISPNSGVGNGLEGGAALQKDFDDAYAVVGFNSNALTESVCEGIPTFSLCPGSMALPMGTSDLSLLEDPKMPDRTQWLYDLAYCQWKESEVASGAMWEHLSQAWPDMKKTRCDRPDWQLILQRKEDYYQYHYIQHWENVYAQNKKIKNKQIEKKFKRRSKNKPT